MVTEYDRDLNPACCPFEDRHMGYKTVNGHPITDLHEHKGLYRGVVLEGHHGSIRQRVMFWVEGGKLSKGADHPFDIGKAIR